MTDRSQLTRPMMSRSTGLNTNQTKRQLFEELEQLSPPDRTIEDNCAVTRDTVNLENVLPKIQSYCRNFHNEAPFLTKDDFCSVPQSATLGADAIHPIRIPEVGPILANVRSCCIAWANGPFLTSRARRVTGCT